MKITWLLYIPDDGWVGYDDEAEARSVMEKIADELRDESAEGWAEDAESLSLYRCGCRCQDTAPTTNLLRASLPTSGGRIARADRTGAPGVSGAARCAAYSGLVRSSSSFPVSTAEVAGVEASPDASAALSGAPCAR